MAKKKVIVEPRSAGRREIGQIRAKLNSMNTTQLKSFYAGFEATDLDLHIKAINKVLDSRKEQEIAEAEEQIRALQDKIKSLKG